jgi:hypothetical protein
LVFVVCCCVFCCFGVCVLCDCVGVSLLWARLMGGCVRRGRGRCVCTYGESKIIST